MGYGAEVWPLAHGSFPKVWGHVLLRWSLLDFLSRLVIGAMFDQEEHPSSNFLFEMVKNSSGNWHLGVFLTFSGFCCALACDGKFGGMRGGMWVPRLMLGNMLRGGETRC